jgi:hypothetical protein
MSHINEWGSGMSFVRDHDHGESYAVVGLAIGGDQHVSCRRGPQRRLP